jgi:Zn-dependent protease with chaperone function
MTSEQFDQLVNRIQTRYGSRPLALRLRIALLVGLGYSGFLAVLLIVLLLASALAIGAVVADQEPSIFLMVIVAVLLAFGLWQALIFLWVPLESEKGREVTRDEAPELFDLLDRLQSDLHVGRFAHVRLTPEFNAGVRMIPRLGVFGFNRRYLYLGLPLMFAMSPEQYAAVLAHEFAHCSSHHDRFGMWIYRLRLTWSRVFTELSQNQTATTSQSLRGIILKFVDWYWPRFNAHAFVLSRADEYEADRIAADWAGGNFMAEALIRLECFANRLDDKFWEEMTQRAKTDSTVPDDIVDRMQTFLLVPPEPTDEDRWLTQAAQRLTGNIDTHPSLADRLKSLGHSADQFARNGFPSVPTHSAATALIGTALPTVTRDVNQLWQKDNTLRWQNHFHQARRLARQLDASGQQPSTIVSGTEDVSSAEIASATESIDVISNASANAPVIPHVMNGAGRRANNAHPEFDVEHAWQQARTIYELQGPAAAESLLRQLLNHQPTHAQANIALGRHLLDRGLKEGEQFLRRILQEDDNDLIPAACYGLINYFQQSGQLDKVQEARAYLSRFETAQAAATKERCTVTPNDKFVAHGLSDEELESLIEALAQQTDLHSAWLVRKELQHFRNQKLFVLVAHSQPHGWLGSTAAELDRKVVANLIKNVQLPGRVLVISPQGGFRPLARAIMKRPEAKLELRLIQR